MTGEELINEICVTLNSIGVLCTDGNIVNELMKYGTIVAGGRELNAWQKKALRLIDVYDIATPVHDITCKISLREDAKCTCWASHQEKDFMKLIEEAKQ